jgi:hypothetical protein
LACGLRSQKGVGAVQSEFPRHCTQAFVLVSHRVAPASVHWLSLRQPGPQVLLFASQTGPAGMVAQSVLVKQTTHWFDLTSQSGVLVPAQSEFVSHWTHCCVEGSHTRAVTGQSAPVWQPTHACDVGSHIGATPPGLQVMPPSVPHGARQVCDRG